MGATETLKYSADCTGEDHPPAGYYWRQPHSNVSSVEEAVEDILNKNQDKSANNNEASVESKSKSPKYLPKFLRASFSKLISKDKAKSQSLNQEALSLPFFSSVSIPSLSSPTTSLGGQNMDSEATDDQGGLLPRACSPTTQQFVEDSLAKGFPLIPFHYTSLDIVEKSRARQRNKEHHPSELATEVSPAR